MFNPENAFFVTSVQPHIPRLLPDVLAKEITETGTKDRQGKTGYILVRTQCDRQKTVDQCSSCSRDKGSHKSDQRRKNAAWLSRRPAITACS